jgi:hypothetical protein
VLAATAQKEQKIKKRLGGGREMTFGAFDLYKM